MRSAVLLGLSGLLVLTAVRAAPPQRLDPAGWGADHVGRPVPEFVSGDECLFCHRLDVGPTWEKNRHNRTIRDAEPGSPGMLALKQAPSLSGLVADVKFVLGNDRQLRFLRPSPEFGRLEMLSVAWQKPGATVGALRHLENPRWDKATFGERCAGCHATGVDVQKKTFATRSLDCFVCHGDASVEHSKDSSTIHLAKKAKNSAQVITSICAQCHVRTGKSKSSGLPFPNNFIAGDNLFRDFEVDLGDNALKALNPADRHVQENVRDVIVLGNAAVTCLSCHDVHKQSSRKHHRVARGDICWNCHNATGTMKVEKPYEVHSRTCEY